MVVKTKRKNMETKIKTGLGVITIIIFAITAGVFVWQFEKKQPPIETAAVAPVGISVKKSNNAAAESAPSGTEDWQTYRNEKYGFEVKYPKDWTVDSKLRLSSPTAMKQSNGETGISAVFETPEDTKYESANDYLTGVIPKDDWNACVIDKKDLMIGGHPAISYETCDFASPRIYNWIVNGKLYSVSVYQDKETVDRILSTFKFIN